MFIELIIFGGIGAFILLFVLTALLERQQLNEFVPAPPGEPVTDSPYFEAMNAAATRLGFAAAGLLVQNRDSKLYQARIALWVSPDQTMLLQIGGGKTARFPIKRTILTSRVAPDHLLQTQDDFGMADLSGLTSCKILINADLDELVACHCERLGANPGVLGGFTIANACAEWEAIRTAKARALARLGLIKFLNFDQTVYRHTLKGAWLQYYRGFRGQLAEGKAQAHRTSKKRPGAMS
jgi:hypothetical protein